MKVDTTRHAMPVRMGMQVLSGSRGGGWEKTSLWAYRGRAIRVCLRRDSYTFQSRFTAEFLTEHGWKELHVLTPERSRSRHYTSHIQDFPTPELLDAVEDDEQVLAEIAARLLDTLPALPARAQMESGVGWTL